jgi:hypothetical protein
MSNMHTHIRQAWLSWEHPVHLVVNSGDGHNHSLQQPKQATGTATKAAATAE